MENIFENAYYGKSYKTRLGGKAIYHYKLDNPTGDGKYDAWHFLIISGEKSHIVCLSNGKSVGATTEWSEDIVSEWTKETNEEEIGMKFTEFCDSDEFRSMDTPYFYFCAGYRKAMEKNNK